MWKSLAVVQCTHILTYILIALDHDEVVSKKRLAMWPRYAKVRQSWKQLKGWRVSIHVLTFCIVLLISMAGFPDSGFIEQWESFWNPKTSIRRGLKTAFKVSIAIPDFKAKSNKYIHIYACIYLLSMYLYNI